MAALPLYWGSEQQLALDTLAPDPSMLPSGSPALIPTSDGGTTIMDVGGGVAGPTFGSLLGGGSPSNGTSFWGALGSAGTSLLGGLVGDINTKLQLDQLNTLKQNGYYVPTTTTGPGLGGTAINGNFLFFILLIVAVFFFLK